MDDARRLAKEAFVTGHAGTTMGEVTLITFSFASAALLSRVLSAAASRAGSSLPSNSRVCTVFEWSWRVFDLFLTASAAVAACCYPEWIPVVVATQIWLGMLLVLGARSLPPSHMRSSTSDTDSFYSLPSPCVSLLRSCVLFLTSVAILAVDFPIFPRRLAKTHAFGVSLMDIGVGAFVVINALTSPIARETAALSSSPSAPATGIIRSSVVSSLPLLALAGLRVATTSAANYQSPAAEYGTHWNFFLTLALSNVATTVLTTLFLPSFSASQQQQQQSVWSYVLRASIFSPRGLGSLLLGTVTAVLHQLWLGSGHPHAPLTLDPVPLTSDTHSLSPFVWGEGAAWALGARRIDFISANKEGIASLPGYIALFLVAIPLGRAVHAAHGWARARLGLLRRQQEEKQQREETRIASSSLAACVAACLLCCFLSSSALLLLTLPLQLPSRRLCNPSYLLWVLALSSALLAALAGIAAAPVEAWIAPCGRGRSLGRGQGQGQGQGQGHGSSSHQDGVHDTHSAHAGVETLERLLGPTASTLTLSPLPFFLVSNLLTGLVNLAVDTLTVSSGVAAGVLVGYLGLSVAGTRAWSWLRGKPTRKGMGEAKTD